MTLGNASVRARVNVCACVRVHLLPFYATPDICDSVLFLRLNVPNTFYPREAKHNVPKKKEAPKEPPYVPDTFDPCCWSTGHPKQEH